MLFNFVLIFIIIFVKNTKNWWWKNWL